MKTVTQKDIARLRNLALKAALASEKYHDRFYALKASPGWKAACDAKDIAPDSNPGDWMC